MHIEIPKSVENILNIINKAGYEAYIVGGCVRDSIIGRNPGDWDITTSAKPHVVKTLFDKTIDTGLKHGTVTVVIDKENYEITTFRVDGEYSDNRHPLSVEFTTSIEDDLARRDFTVNAMAYHPEIGIVDPFGGVNDIKGKVIKAVGEASLRFNEDALRMLRAIRFSAQLDFTIEDKTFEAIKLYSKLIKNISFERIRDEITKLITSNKPEKFSLLYETGMLKFIMPEFEPCFKTEQKNPWHVYNVAEHILNTVAGIEADKILRWTMLLHDVGKPAMKTTDEKGIDHFYGHQDKSVKIAEAVLKRLRLDNCSISRILRLIKYHDRQIEPNERSVRKAVAAIGDGFMSDLFKVMEADKRGQNPVKFGESIKKLEEVKKIYKSIKENGHPISIKDMAIDGDDLQKLGIKPGKELGELLNSLFQLVIDKPEMNNRECLINYVNELIR